jgi:hypothetical protein
MRTRSAELAERFIEATEQVVTLVEEISDERWGWVTSAEGWTVAAVAHHIARAFLPEAALIQQVARGEEIMAAYKDWTIIHSSNAERKEQFAACTKDEVVELLRANREEALAIVRELSDSQLDNAAVIPIIRPEPLTAGQLVEGLLIGHINGHVASIQATVA